MKHVFYFAAIVILVAILAVTGQAQTEEVIHPSVVKTGVFLGETPPLRDLPTLTEAEMEKLAKRKENENELNEELAHRSYPNAKNALPKGADPAWQKTMGGKSALSNAPIQNFSGQTSSSYPPDCNGTVGPNHYMQTVNSTYAIYNKTGTKLAGPTAMNLLFNGVTGASRNDGDPLILYDEQADRWLAVEFSVPTMIVGTGNDYMLIAVSTTNDPTGTWYAYSFDVANGPDYEKFGIWRDGYYMGVNNSSGNDIYVFERSKMLLGQTAQMIGFDNPNRPGSVDGFMCVPPADNDGTFAPAGSPGIFISVIDDAWNSGYTDQLWIYELTADWTTPANSTFTRKQQISVTSFDSNFGTDWYNITQPGTTMQLDAIPQVLMNVPQYRNFGTYQTLVCCHTVDVDATDHAGVRWYELRRGTETSGGWAIRQQGTYAPDASSRWMGSIMLNGSGQLGLGYSISSSSLYPGIRYTGQSSSAYAAAAGTMDITEQTIQTGSYSQTSYERWGDYALMSVDPTDDQTFWFTTEYMLSSSSHGSKIASFKLGNSPTALTQAATSVTGTTATLNGSVNPNGLATTYYFQWGTTTSYGNTTTSTSAGSGSSTVAVSAGITGLTGGTTYHFRVVATNSDGTTNGSDLTLTPGAAAVTTTAASSITQTTATSGGNVTTDGGSTVTARGVCWSTTASPTISGSHTTDGSGTGTFTSSITGLTANTTYYVRAYATNGSGTYYGDQLSFTTACGIYNTLTFYELFSGTAIPSCWAQVDNVGNGQVWQFGTITGYTPLPSLTGNYAYLNSDAYGSGNSQNADLVTPTIDLTNYGNVTLRFKYYFRSYTGSTATVSYSINNGSTWTQLAQYTTTSANPATYNTTIAALAGQSNVKFKWNYTGSYGYYWAVDSVRITGTALPTVSTTTPSSIAQTTASSGGNVSSAGGATVTARGVCWATTANPTTANSKTTDGSGTGTFTSSITGLSANTTYHVRAYATNSGGTAYGADQVFTTCASGLVASVSVAASANPVCSGTSVTFTATPTNGGTTPTYQWYKNTVAQGTGATYAYTPVTGDVVYCVMTSNASCVTGSPATSNSVTMTVNSNVTASVSAAASANPVCSGTSVTFTATPTNGGTTPTYQWYKNTVAQGTGTTYSYTPLTGDVVYCVMTSNAACVTGSPATSSSVYMTVNNNVAASVSVAASANPVCQGTSVTFTASPTNGGTTPTYQWYKNTVAQGTGSTYAYTPVHGDVVYCVMTSNATCVTGSPATSGSVTMTVNNNVAASVSVAASANPVCQGTSVTFTASPTNGGTTPTYQWYKNSVLQAGNTSTYAYAPAQGDVVYCKMTSNATCVTGSPATSGSITMTVNSNVTASVAIGASANPVYAGTSVTFTATPGNGGSTPSYQWKVNGSNAGTNSTSFTYTPSDGDIVSCVMTSNAACVSGSPATSNSISMAVLPVYIPVTLNVLLEGLYSGGGTMSAAADQSGPHWGSAVADKVTVELHSSSNYSTVVYTASDLNLSTGGQIVFSVPGVYNGSYYITIRHRNSIETVSGAPVSFSGGSVTYNMTDLASRAYGNNLANLLDSYFGIYAGDINQDGTVDDTDVISVDHDALLFLTGYLTSDINGDGIIDARDVYISDNNAARFIQKSTP